MKTVNLLKKKNQMVTTRQVI